MTAFEICVILQTVLSGLLSLCYGGLVARVDKLEKGREDETLP